LPAGCKNQTVTVIIERGGCVVIIFENVLTLERYSTSQLLNEIMPMIYRRFNEKTAEEWRQIYKVGKSSIGSGAKSG
jgi:hypothetical protein